MNRGCLASLIIPIVALSAQAQTPGNGTPAPQAGEPGPTPDILVGAYSKVPLDTPVVKEARDFLQSRLVSLTLGEVSVAYVQVVAGLNVKLVCDVMEDGQTASWKFVAYRSLDGHWHFWLAEHL